LNIQRRIEVSSDKLQQEQQILNYLNNSIEIAQFTTRKRVTKQRKMYKLKLIAAALVVAVSQAFVPLAPPSKQNHPHSQPSSALFSGKTTTLPSGLQYIDLVVGEGRQPGKSDFVSVHYEGKQNGKVFDSTRSANDVRSDVYRGDPFSFPLGRGKVIKGWEEGLSTMSVGGKRRLVVPPELAYGKDGSPDGVIKPNANLVFDIELVSVDGSMDAAGALGAGFGTALGLIVINGLTAFVTGHELREYLNGSLN
jgi:peptidylprolyl isomerase